MSPRTRTGNSQDWTEEPTVPSTPARYDPVARVRTHMIEAADEGAVFLRRILRGEVDPTKENLQLATHARGALGGFTRYEATLSARDQTSVIVSKLLSGEDRDEFARYVAASMPDHPAIRSIALKPREIEAPEASA